MSVMSGNLAIQPFLCKSIPSAMLRASWERWLRGLKNVLAAAKIVDGSDKKNHLLALGGFELQDVFYGIPGADVEATDVIDPFEVAIQKLEAYFAPKHHDAFMRYLFWSLSPEQGEPIEKFLLRAQHHAEKCQFGQNQSESREISIIDKIVLWAPTELREKLLEKKHLTLDQLTKTVNAFQTVKFQANEMSANNNVDTNRVFSRDQNRPSTSFFGVNCTRCGRNGHDSSDQRCPARKEKCHKCGTTGHFSRKCRTRAGMKRPNHFEETNSTSKSYSREQPKRQRTNVRQIEYEDPDKTIEEKCAVYNVNERDDLVWCEVGGVSIEMLIDSGSTYNLIDSRTWEYMKLNGVAIKEQRMDNSKQFMAYGKCPLKLLQVFDSSIVINDSGEVIKQDATFYVIENGQQPLLGKITAKSMGLLLLGLPSTHGQNIGLIVNRKPFPKIKGILIDIPIDKNIKPIQQPIRRCPIALVSKMKSKIEELLDLDIIEEVNQASSWVSPLVPVLKDNGDLRICVDMRRANMAIVRENHPLPTIDGLFSRLGNATYFTQLDLKNGFHQCELDPSCRHITTFITPWGMYRYKRLIFGVNCAPELFQKLLEQLLSGCHNVVNYIDDIVVFGASEVEHDGALRNVLAVLKAHGVLLNSQKCKFKVKQITFLGHNLSKLGIEPSIDKVEAIKRFRSPKTREELRSFLGLVTFVARFLPDLATLNAPLRLLTKTSTPFVWDSTCQKSFESIKQIMSNVKALGYFNEKDKTLVVADASGVALGAVLIQYDNLNCPRVIMFASKSLSDGEKRFSQTEKEALSLVWAVERFKLYLLGIQFELETDHKPLETIFGKKSRPCARIERWVLRLQAFDYKVVYRRGKANLADPLSRLPLCRNDNPLSEDSDCYIRAVVQSLCELTCEENDSCTNVDFDPDVEASVRAIHESAALDIIEIELASEADPELQEVKSSIETGNWSSKVVKDYAIFKEELGFTNNLIVRNSKLVIPKTLRPRMLVLAHEGHPGVSLMKSRLRDRCWWPRMDTDVQKLVFKCTGCQLVSLPERPEPMARKELPCQPWIDLALDYLGPFPSGESILVVIDYYSRYFEARIVPNQTGVVTIDCLDDMFTRLGFPMSITFDNAKQLLSTVVTDYCLNKGIKWNNTIPYWPQANGEVERQNRSLLKRLRIGHQMYGDWKSELKSFLQMYYTTPHSVTGKTPTELMFGRTIRSKLPSINDLRFTPVSSELRDNDRISKLIGKQKEDARRHATKRELDVGDTVLMQNLLPGGKFRLNFHPQHYTVIKKNGPSVTVKNNETGKEYQRNIAHLKRIPVLESSDSDQDDTEDAQGNSSPEEDFLGFEGDAPHSTNKLSNPNTNPASVPDQQVTTRTRQNIRCPQRYR